MSTTGTLLRYPEDKYVFPPQLSCPGCGLPLALRYFVMAMSPNPVILVVPPGCISTVKAPTRGVSGWERVASPFGNAAILAGGLKTALEARGDTKTEVVPWTGDGATFDIGLAAVSGAAERNEDILYVCYDNEAYQNTGNQRSSASPWGSTNTTNPSGAPKKEAKKDIMMILMAHRIPYAATASVAYPDDFMMKVRKAKNIAGFRFLHIFIPCPTGWGFLSQLSIKISKLAVETMIFPLFEVKNGTDITINKQPKGMPVSEYVKLQRRFRHLTPEQIATYQGDVNRRWEWLQHEQRGEK